MSRRRKGVPDRGGSERTITKGNTMIKQISLVMAVGLVAACGGGGSESSNPFVEPPVVIDEPSVVIEPPVVIEPIEPPVVKSQMSRPSDCLTVGTSTGDPLRKYVTCDGVLISHGVSYPYDADNTEIALIDILVVFDTKMTDLDGLTKEEFVQREFDFANKVFVDSGVFIELQVAGIEMVTVAAGDLRKQYSTFTKGYGEFRNLNVLQQQYNADYAFLFKDRETNAIACGVAVLHPVRDELRQRRGITQCYQGDTFNETEATRYYERAGDTFVHEVGHLFGLEHDVDSATYDPVFQYSYGYALPNSYGTIMSYSDKGTGRFSDPTQYFIIPETGNSVSLGTVEADAVSHLNRVRYYMSQLHEGIAVPEAVPPAEPRPPRTPVETDTCGDTPENVFCGVPFSPNALATNVDEEMPITTPAGKIHASRFTTAGSIDTSGAMRWHSPSWADQSQANVWISKVAGGDPVGEHCTDAGSSIIDVVYGYEETQYDRCVLEQGQDYYVNFEYTTSDYSSSMIQTVNTIPGVPHTPVPEWNGDNYDIPVSVIESRSRTDELLTTPSKQGVVSSKLEMGSNAAAYGEFVWHPVPGDKLNPRLDVWISTTPNGPAIDDVYGAFYRGVLVEKIKWSSTPMNSRVYLEPYGVYYINMKSSEYREEATRVDRWVRTLTRTTTTEPLPVFNNASDDIKICLF